MIESKLTELLERAGEQTAVGPPPLDALRAGAARRRRRRTVGWSAASALTVAAVIAGTTLLTNGTNTVDPQPPIASTPPAPVALRVVGFGHATIAVPRAWGTNQSQCGTPQRNTVQIDDPTLVLFCMARRPAGVDSVELGSGPTRLDFRADQKLQIDGVPAERQRTICYNGGNYDGGNGVRVCASTVLIPSLDVWFRAESSTSAAEVDRILGRIAIVPDQAGLPSYQALQRGAEGPKAPEGPKGAEYAALLRELGLQPVFETRKSPGYVDGTILGVVPNPGTMLTPGTKVTITVAGQ